MSQGMWFLIAWTAFLLGCLGYEAWRGRQR